MIKTWRMTLWYRILCSVVSVAYETFQLFIVDMPHCYSEVQAHLRYLRHPRRHRLNLFRKSSSFLCNVRPEKRSEKIVHDKHNKFTQKCYRYPWFSRCSECFLRCFKKTGKLPNAHYFNCVSVYNDK